MAETLGQQQPGRKTDERLSFVQIAINTCDPAGTLRLYSEVFGAISGGGNAFWGGATRSQGLNDDARGTVWWLVGRQPFLQFEIFQHTFPAQRPLPEGHRPCDIGWTRYGLAVADFDQALAALKRNRVPTITDPIMVDGLRRVAFHDPFVGAVVEILEDGTAVPGRTAPYSPDPRPAIVYAACSVSDLEAAREFYGKMLGLDIGPREILHRPEHEALWGLEGAQTSGFVVRMGDRFIEVVEYRTPKGRPKPSDHKITDQGIMNIALGSRNIPFIRELHARFREQGVTLTPAFGNDDAMASYIIDPEREIELIGLSETYDEVFGFVPGKPFFDQ